MTSPPPKSPAATTEEAANKPSPKKPRQRRQAAPETQPPQPPQVVPYPPYMMNPPPGYPNFTQQYPPPPPPPGTPQAPQYAYPVHHSPYPPHYYPQYPPQMMMYGPPPTHPQPDPTGSPPASQGTKRKRKSNTGKDKASDDEGASPDLGTAQQKAAALELKKRTKTQRACDSCRSRKIRCDILSDAEPPRCQHCKQYAFECTFFLPITETRFKKKKLEEENAEKAESKSPVAEKRDSSVFAHLLHSQASISSRIYEGYDSRYHHTFEVSATGDGLIRVEKPSQGEGQMSLPKPVDLHIEPAIVEQLLNAYFAEVAPILPIMTQAEFLSTPAPPPILLYSMCLVAAARREVPQAVFDSIRYAVNGVIKAEDVLSTPSLANVQALLILCMTGDCHSQFVPTALSALWARLGAAIRMAQDLGLHRAELVKQQDIELRRRVWGVCLISDRWSSLVYGFPYMIDVHDCDVRLPSSGDARDLYICELVRLSVIGGRVVKTIYSPSGLTLISDEILYKLLADIEAWKTNLPENLQFRGSDTPQSAGLLHLLYTSVCMIFWRVFMRISYSCPAHLKFGLTVEQWSALVQLTGESIDWLDAHERVYDVWLLVAYAATSCAFVQYHTWVRRQDPEAVAKLKKLRDCVRRWEGSLSPDHMSATRKTAEIITLLYEATQGPALPLEAPALNPTGGVVGKQPLALNYKPDPTRPGGGVFIAHKDSQDDFKDLPAGMVIKDSDGTETGTQGSGSGPASGSGPMVNLTPLTGRGGANVNPAMNAVVSPGQVQVMNVLDVPQASNTLADFAMTDSALLEGIPGGMFDWGQWDTFFSRINPATQGGPVGMPAGFEDQQARQQRQA
ncbi:fungal-specific transcription factor domain-containing protein [Mycena maculata]|uniref:Fungal-specific transcription factor domain-containing protein n=1 Tax=Mycena maculata TaxID=230809 RepID=A0AAD7IGQ1_9AGAR|nr:fungal-specific transcription factor domain-containing protein [Mycena maculata]